MNSIQFLYLHYNNGTWSSANIIDEVCFVDNFWGCLLSVTDLWDESGNSLLCAGLAMLNDKSKLCQFGILN